MVENIHTLIEQATGLAFDSREVKPGELFFAIKGTPHEADEYAKAALERGALAAVVSAKSRYPASDKVFKADNPLLLSAISAAEFYKRAPKIITAVTGTNGKTSIGTFARQMLDHAGMRAASIGTLGISAAEGTVGGSNTTPYAIELQKTLRHLYDKGFTAIAMEASSHGLDQYRLDGIRLQSAGFTNLTRDHLDYHKTTENYIKAKQRLFSDILLKDGVAVLNADSEYFESFKSACHGKTIHSYGTSGKEYRLVNRTVHDDGQHLTMEIFGKTYEILFPVFGHFQTSNLLCALGMAVGTGIKPETLIPLIPDIKAPHGRMELAVTLKNGAKIFVDYAHTPDALENAITALRPHTKGKLKVLFGCGGDRDPGKRPIMGDIASRLADAVYVTDDNPRTEDPLPIRAAILASCKKGHDAGDRRTAIHAAVAELKAGDVLLLAGKGHETYQLINGITHPFDDAKEAMDAAKDL